MRFLIRGGIEEGRGVLLAGGAAGDFSTMSFDERVQVTRVIVEEVEGRIPVVMGAQTTSTLELVQLAQAAEETGAEFIQVSPPFYFPPTADDIYEYVKAAAEAANVGIILYNTFWTSTNLVVEQIGRLAGLPNMVGLKWSAPDIGNMEFEQVVSRFASRFLHHRQPASICYQPYDGSQSYRGSRLQLLAPVGCPDAGLVEKWPLRRSSAGTGAGGATVL